MAEFRVVDKVGLGRLVLSAATSSELREKLLKDPAGMLAGLIERLPPGHVIKVVKEEANVTFLVIPSEDNVPVTVEEKEAILREEAREYDQVRNKVEESKKRDSASEKSSIPSDIIEETYAFMVGHTALSPSSRALDASLTPEHALAARLRLRKAVEIDPQDAFAWSSLADVLVFDYLSRWNNAGKEELDEAEIAVQRALTIDPHLALAYYAVGLLHRARGDHLKALEAFDQALKCDPNFARAYAERGAELINVGRPEDAPSLVEKAISLEPRNPSLGRFYWVVGQAHFFVTRYSEAIAWLHRSIELQPNLWYNWLYLVSAYALAGDKSEATQLLTQFRRRFHHLRFTIALIHSYEQVEPNSNAVVVEGRRIFHEGLLIAGMEQ